MTNFIDISEYKKFGFDVFIHDTAIIKHPQFCEIGSHNAIDNGVTIATELMMGDYIHIAPYVVVIGGKKSKLILKDFSFVASGTKIVCGSEDYTGSGLVGPTIPEKYRELTYSTITFEKYAGCGVNCSIMPGVTLAEGSILGANSLLTKNTEPWTIYVGSPAKPVKIRDKDTIIKYGKELGY
jgi:acetyltransferase-like isoleucine patch superfamily enzyme